MPNFFRVDLLDPSRWSLRWNDVINGTAPLTKSLSPFTFSAEIIAFYADNPDKASTWNYAGMLAQKASLVAFGGGAEVIQENKIFLGRYTLLLFEFVPTTSYRLEFQPANWHSKMIIKAWEYTT